MNFYECCDLTKKVYLKLVGVVFAEYSYVVHRCPIYCYTSPAANPMHDVFPVFSRNYVFFCIFLWNWLKIKTRKSCNSLLVHYNYKIRKLCKLIPFNRYSSILAFFFKTCLIVLRFHVKKVWQNLQHKTGEETTNHKLAYILYYCGSLKLKSSYCMRTLHMELFFASILFKKGFISI